MPSERNTDSLAELSVRLDMSADISRRLEAVLEKRGVSVEDFLLELLEARFPIEAPVNVPAAKSKTVLQEFRYLPGETLFGAIARLGDTGRQAAGQLHNALTRYKEYKGRYPDLVEALSDVMNGHALPKKLPPVPPTPRNLFEHLVILLQKDQHHAAVKAARD